MWGIKMSRIKVSRNTSTTMCNEWYATWAGSKFHPATLWYLPVLWVFLSSSKVVKVPGRRVELLEALRVGVEEGRPSTPSRSGVEKEGKGWNGMGWRGGEKGWEWIRVKGRGGWS